MHSDCMFKPLPLSLIPGRHEEESKTDTRVTNMSWATLHSGQRLQRAPRDRFPGLRRTRHQRGEALASYYHERDIEMAVHGQGVSLLELGRDTLKRAKSDRRQRQPIVSERSEQVHNKTAQLASAALWAQGTTIGIGRLAASGPASPSMSPSLQTLYTAVSVDS